MKLPTAYANLGIVTEMVIQYKGYDYVHTWPKTGSNRRHLLGAANGKSFLVLKPRRVKRRIMSDKQMSSTLSEASDATDLLKKWGGQTNPKYLSINIPNYKLIKFGTVISISYIATKDGRNAEYVHDFKHRNTAKINKTSDGKNPPIVHVSGQFVKITKRGILG